MAQPKANLLKSAPKNKRKTRQQAASDMEYGTEPNWDNVKNVDRQMLWAYSFYARSGNTKKAKDFVIEYLKNNEEYTTECVKNFRAVQDIEINRSICYMSRMITLGARLEQKYVDRLHSYIAKMILLGKNIRKERANTEESKISVYDRVKEQSNEIIAEFEFLRDYFWEKPRAFSLAISKRNPLSILKEFEASQAHARIIKKEYENVISEIKLAIAGTDPDINEGYSCYTKKQLTSYSSFLQDIIDACDIIIGESVQQRKPRKKKPVSVDKKVAKIKCAISDPTVGVVGEKAVNLVGANVAFVYNKKTRKLGVYIAQDSTGLDVKGTKIISFNQETSQAKTLRKPKEQLKNIGNARTKALKYFENEVKTTNISLNGSMNDQIVIVKTFK